MSAPGRRCPVCGAAANDATPVDGHAAPKPNDVAVCLYCSAILVYDDALRLRLPVGEDRAQLHADPQIARVRQMVRVISTRRALQ